MEAEEKGRHERLVGRHQERRWMVKVGQKIAEAKEQTVSAETHVEEFIKLGGS